MAATTTQPALLPHYTPIALVGKGSQGQVWKCLDASRKATVAVKVISMNSQRSLRVIERELTAALMLSRPTRQAGLVVPYECVRGAGFLGLVEPYVDGTVLSHAPRMPHSNVRQTAWQLASVLQHCHERGIYIRDVKPDNVLLAAPTASVCVCDFGLAVTSEHAHGMAGTFGYMAPEVIQCGLAGGAYSCAPVDVWSLGAVLHSCFFGKAPFGVAQLMMKQPPPPDPATAMRQALDAITANSWRDFVPRHVPASIPGEAASLLDELLHHQPSERPGLADVMQSKWFRGGNLERSCTPYTPLQPEAQPAADSILSIHQALMLVKERLGTSIM